MDRYTAFNLLHLDQNYDENSLKKAYKKEVSKVHPDSHPNLPNAKEITQKLNEAYDLLKKQLKNNYNTSYNSEFQNYKSQVLKEIENIISKIKVNNKYMNESVFDFYQRYINLEKLSLNLLRSTIKFNCFSKSDILKKLSDYELEHSELLKKFIDNMFNKFYNNYSLYINDSWLKNKCNSMITKWDENLYNMIDPCMEYYVNSKELICKEFIENKLEYHLNYQIPKNSENYIRRDVNDVLLRKLLNKYDLEVLIKNQNIIFSEVFSYIKLQKQIYKMFLEDKNKKIAQLNELIIKNKLKNYKEQINELKEEKNKNKFNYKYTLLKNEIDELLVYKESAIMKFEIDKCSESLVKKYNKCRKQLLHENNFKQCFYYLSMIQNKEIELGYTELLNYIEFKNIKKDSKLLEEIENCILSSKLEETEYKKKILNK